MKFDTSSSFWKNIIQCSLLERLGKFVGKDEGWSESIVVSIAFGRGFLGKLQWKNVDKLSCLHVEARIEVVCRKRLVIRRQRRLSYAACDDF